MPQLRLYFNTIDGTGRLSPSAEKSRNANAGSSRHEGGGGRDCCRRIEPRLYKGSRKEGGDHKEPPQPFKLGSQQSQHGQWRKNERTEEGCGVQVPQRKCKPIRVVGERSGENDAGNKEETSVPKRKGHEGRVLYTGTIQLSLPFPFGHHLCSPGQQEFNCRNYRKISEQHVPFREKPISNLCKQATTGVNRYEAKVSAAEMDRQRGQRLQTTERQQGRGKKGEPKN